MPEYEQIAALYDAAFDWESDPEVILPLYEAMGSPQRIIECCCGPARLLEILIRRGVDGVGVDISPAMLALAADRLADVPGDRFELVQADLAEFEFPRPCGGAFCAVGSFGHFDTPAKAHAHLARMSAALTPGSIYAVQLGLQPLVDTPGAPPNEHSTWEFNYAGDTLSYCWFGRGVSAARQHETQVSRIEWLSGQRRGDVLETEHSMCIWDWLNWSDLIARHGFEQIAALDPNDQFSALAIGPELHHFPVAWHLLKLTNSEHL